MFATSSKDTYMSAMYQLSSQNLEATPNSDKPIRVIVGAITSGPMNRSSRPTKPLAPITTCITHTRTTT